MDDLLSVIINLRDLDMSNINSKGYSLDICGRKVFIVRTPKMWIITIMTNNHVDYVCKFIFDVRDTIRVIICEEYLHKL